MQEEVLVVGRTKSKLEQLKSELGCHTFESDATNELSVREMFEHASGLGTIGSISVCIGSILLKPVHMTSVDEFTDTWRLNVLPAFLSLKYGIPQLRNHGGSILLFSSAAAEIGLPNHEAISSAKSGVVGLMRSAAATYAAQNIRVNCIAPGLVRTPLSERITSNANAEKASIDFHPLKRLGEPSDIASLAAWLLTAESAWATGQVFTVDGGLAGLKVH